MIINDEEESLKKPKIDSSKQPKRKLSASKNWVLVTILICFLVMVLFLEVFINVLIDPNKSSEPTTYNSTAKNALLSSKRIHTTMTPLKVPTASDSITAQTTIKSSEPTTSNPITSDAKVNDEGTERGTPTKQHFSNFTKPVDSNLVGKEEFSDRRLEANLTDSAPFGLRNQDAKETVKFFNNDRAYGVHFQNNIDESFYEPVCGLRCQCGMPCSLEKELQPSSNCADQKCDDYAHIGEAPWHVALKRLDVKGYSDHEKPASDYRKFYCGGSIINRNWILTAASCLKLRVNSRDLDVVKEEDLKIHVGWNQNNEQFHGKFENLAKSYGRQIYDVQQVLMHPNYRGNYDGLFDIGLVELNRSILYPKGAFSDNADSDKITGKTLARPVCFADSLKSYKLNPNSYLLYAHGFDNKEDTQPQQMKLRNPYETKKCWKEYKDYER